jgi:hypothetical protein
MGWHISSGSAQSRHRRRTGRRGRARLAVAIAILGLLPLAAPVSATVIDRDTYAGSDAWTYDDCGFLVDATITFGGRVLTRVGTGDLATAFFGHEETWFREVDVRRSDGSTLIISGHLLFQETRAVPIDGSVFEFTSVHAGQPLVVEDASGRILLMDRGNVLVTVLFDTQGDDVPGGIVIEVTDVRVAGPHPSQDVDLCRLFG